MMPQIEYQGVKYLCECMSRRVAVQGVMRHDSGAVSFRNHENHIWRALLQHRIYRLSKTNTDSQKLIIDIVKTDVLIYSIILK
jgi:hypothetical protein